MKELHRSNSLSEELFRALQVDEIGSNPGPGVPTDSKLQKLVSELKGLNEASLFGSFMNTREVADRPVRLSFPYSRLTRRLNPAPMPLFGRSGEVRTDQDSLITSADVTKDELIPISSEGTTRVVYVSSASLIVLTGTAEYQSRQESRPLARGSGVKCAITL